MSKSGLKEKIKEGIDKEVEAIDNTIKEKIVNPKFLFSVLDKMGNFFEVYNFDDIVCGGKNIGSISCMITPLSIKWYSLRVKAHPNFDSYVDFYIKYYNVIENVYKLISENKKDEVEPYLRKFLETNITKIDVKSWLKDNGLQE